MTPAGRGRSRAAVRESFNQSGAELLDEIPASAGPAPPRSASTPQRYPPLPGLRRHPDPDLRECGSPDVPGPALKAACTFVSETLGGGGRGLLLTGPMGHGKSHLAAACLLELTLCNADEDFWGYRWGRYFTPPAAYWVNPAQHLARLKSCFDARERDLGVQYERQLLSSDDRSVAPRVLVVDDLGRGQRPQGTDFERDSIEQILRIRYDLALPTLITSNYGLRELDDKCNVGDMLTEMCEVVPSVRPEGSGRAAAGRRTG